MELFAAWAASVTTLVVITAVRVSAIEKRLREHEARVATVEMLARLLRKARLASAFRAFSAARLVAAR